MLNVSVEVGLVILKIVKKMDASSIMEAVIVGSVTAFVWAYLSKENNKDYELRKMSKRDKSSKDKSSS